MARHRRRGSTRKPVKILPVPAAVSGGKHWTVREAAESETPHVDLGTYQMAVPVDPSGIAAWIRLHEMAHARWTPVNAGKTAAAEGVQPLTANACEDARIHRKLADAGFRCGRALDEHDVEKMAENFAALDALDMARLMMSSIGTGDEQDIRRMLHSTPGGPAIDEVVRDVWRQCFGKRRPAYPRTIEAAKALEEWFAKPPDPDSLESMGKTLERLRDVPDTGQRAPGEAVWAAMKVETPPTPLRLPSTIRTRKRRALQEGSVPRHWHRYPTDGAVFDRKTRRLAGGAVLIDQSGSMHLEPYQVLEILLAAPAAVVATYAGSGHVGVLRVLAKDGKRVLDENVHIRFNNNSVDGPALEWIARHPGPRFWVSDGLATSLGGDAIRSAARIAMKHSIVRVDDVRGLIEALRERR